ncbi:hypothetical protein IFM89_004450 [Coptis chinensis]|uniref:S-acyltransferase n=1 Tax=Coptis chinensis TaxID=261450 RepID=A0A835LA02_9MAGN|nr:hypothetical protein IFM89_004450 [Coptis chinensis]
MATSSSHFQVAAISVFFFLVIAFYLFFAPFLGSRALEYASIAIYSPVALLVFILYVRSTAINPADPGILSLFDAKPDINPLSAKNLPGNFDEVGNRPYSSPSSASRSSIGADSSRKGYAAEANRIDTPTGPASHRPSSVCNVGGIFCALFVIEDCCKLGRCTEQQGEGEAALFCTLCNAELVIEAGVGIAVLVNCFVHKHDMNRQIKDRLGDGFSRAPFATLVAVFSAVSLLACLPLGELFFFHIILIRKGITTYEYVVAMRAMSEAPGGASVDEMPTLQYSPSGSATTGLSGGSSLGLQYKGAWCTPPRVFVDYQEEVVPHLDPGMVPSTVDPDAAGFAERRDKQPKRPVRMSAWKLAKLDSSEAMRAAAKARASSSVFRPVESRHSLNPDLSSSENMSIRSSVSTDIGGNKISKNELGLSPYGNVYTPSHGSQDDYETGTQSVSSFSSPSHIHESVKLSPIPLKHMSGPSNPTSTAPRFIPSQPFTSNAVPSNNPNNPMFHSSNSEFDDKIMKRGSTSDPMLLAPPNSLYRDAKRTSVVWDQEAGRYVSIPVSTRTIEASHESRLGPALQVIMTNTGAETSRKPVVPPPESSSAVNALVQQPEKLMYTGESIFFGGPLLSAPLRDGPRSVASMGIRQDNEGDGYWHQETKMGKASSSNQFPVFNPRGFERELPRPK